MTLENLLQVLIAFSVLYLAREYGRFCFRVGYKRGRWAAVDHINVLCTTTGDDYIFRELVSENFLCQTRDYDVGVDSLKKRFPGKTIIVSRD